jgi:hypothetical protein
VTKNPADMFIKPWRIVISVDPSPDVS